MTITVKKKHLVEQLNSRSIPVLPSGATHLLQSLTDEDIGFRDLAAIVEQHPVIAGRLVALANSAWSSPQEPITSLDDVCSRLGVGVVRSTSVALAVASAFDARRCPAFDVAHHWTSALLAADACSRLAQRVTLVSKMDQATARISGLLHNIGLLWLADQLPNEVDEAISTTAVEEHASLNVVIAELVGIDIFAAGGQLATAWKLPEPFVTAISHCREGMYDGAHWEFACVVSAGSSIVSVLLAGEDRLEPCDSFDRLGISKDTTRQVSESIAKQLGKTEELAQILFGG